MTSDRPLKSGDQGDQHLQHAMDEVIQARQTADRTERSRDSANVTDLDLRTDAEKRARAEELMAIFNRPGNEAIAEMLAKNLREDAILKKQLSS